MNQVLENIKTRRSVRQYSGETVDPGQLDAVLLAGRQAPSGGNSQSSHFIVVLNAEVRQRLSALVCEAFAKMEITENTYKSLAYAIGAAKKGEFDFTMNAPVLVVVANKKGYGNALSDSACALQNMMLAAHSLGLGSCWVNQLRWLDENPEVNACLRGLGLGEDETVCGGLVLGVPKGSAAGGLEITGNAVTFVR